MERQSEEGTLKLDRLYLYLWGVSVRLLDGQRKREERSWLLLVFPMERGIVDLLCICSTVVGLLKYLTALDITV